VPVLHTCACSCQTAFCKPAKALPKCYSFPAHQGRTINWTFCLARATREKIVFRVSASAAAISRRHLFTRVAWQIERRKICSINCRTLHAGRAHDHSPFFGTAGIPAEPSPILLMRFFIRSDMHTRRLFVCASTLTQVPSSVSPSRRVKEHGASADFPVHAALSRCFIPAIAPDPALCANPALANAINVKTIAALKTLLFAAMLISRPGVRCSPIRPQTELLRTAKAGMR